MPLSPGARLGAYEIVGALGAGGMGEVYRARDTKLGRDVALKLLPEAFARDSQRLGRFQREAQVLASLNHPHIAQIYGLEDSSGTSALVMELVEGATLAERLARGPLPVDEALTIAHQVADALEAAHERGIVHRDLKPGNIVVSAGGTAKVLDFGLAAVAQDTAAAHVDATHSPTLSIAATGVGMILGTAAYMAPEQAAGKSVDKRADIWSFGVVLWEMLTGARLFDGETVSHTLADVLRAPIDFEKLPRQTPPGVRNLLRRCLDRDTRTRLRDIGEARIVIERAAMAPEAGPAAQRAQGRSSRSVAVAYGVAALALAAATALALLHFREAPATSTPVRFHMQPPEQTSFVASAVLSPDGQYLTFTAPGPDGRPMLWLRALNAVDARPLTGTENAGPAPFWAPNSRFIGFGALGFPGSVKKVDVAGGPPQTLSRYTGAFRQAAWGPAGFIVYGSQGSGLMRVSEAGGTPEPLTTIDQTRGEQHSEPVFLPDGRRLLYLRTFVAASEDNGIYVGALDAAPQDQSATRLLAADSGAIYVPLAEAPNRGHLLFLRGGTLLAQAFDPAAVELTGDAVPIAENVGATTTPTSGLRYGWFSASQTGTLAFRTGGATAMTELVWFDRAGKRLGQVGPSADYNNFNLAPDGRRITAQRAGGLLGEFAAQNARLWIAEVSRGVFSRLLGEGFEGGGVMSPDNRVALTSTANGALGDLYWVLASGVGSPEPLLVKSPTVKHANHFSHDGRFLIFDDHSPKQFQDLWVLNVASEGEPRLPDRKPIPFLVTSADETFGQFSPDERWVAYSSNESGRREVYVQGFAADRVPAAAVGKWQVSTSGGDKPRWRRDGSELYYIAPDGKLMAVPIKAGASFEVGVATPLFDIETVGFFPYDVAADGRFLVLTPVAASDQTSPVTVVLNWQAALPPR